MATSRLLPSGRVPWQTCWLQLAIKKTIGLGGSCLKFQSSFLPIRGSVFLISSYFLYPWGWKKWKKLVTNAESMSTTTSWRLGSCGTTWGTGGSTFYVLNWFVLFCSPWLLVKTIKTLTAEKLALWTVAADRHSVLWILWVTHSCTGFHHGPKVFTLTHSFVWNQTILLSSVFESYKCSMPCLATLIMHLYSSWSAWETVVLRRFHGLFMSVGNSTKWTRYWTYLVPEYPCDVRSACPGQRVHEWPGLCSEVL